MGTSFFAVYKRATTEFNDPTLKSLLETQPVLFGQAMYNFLENAISLFTEPLKAQKRVRDYSPPIKNINYFNGDGVTSVYRLNNPPAENQLENTLIQYKVNNVLVEGSYDPASGIVTLAQIPEEGATVCITVYYCGEWNIVLYPEEEYILSQFILACWSEYINNNKLDIIRLLGDTDFKLTSNSSTTTSKTAWNIVNREVATKRMSNFAWTASMSKLYND